MIERLTIYVRPIEIMAYFFDLRIFDSPNAAPIIAQAPDYNPAYNIYSSIKMFKAITAAAVYSTSNKPEIKVRISKIHHSAQAIIDPEIPILAYFHMP